MSETTVRELVSEAEWLDAFPVMKQLRTHLDEDTYFEYLREMTADGYRLFGLFSDGELAALAGVGITTNMYYGRHLWVFELVTDFEHRSRGFGEELLEYLSEWAERMGCTKIALSSGLQREDAHRFYEERADMDRVSYVFTRELGSSS